MKEKIHDEQIVPLLEQIIDICLRNDIEYVATFAIGDPSQPGSMASSVNSQGRDKVIKFIGALLVANGSIRLPQAPAEPEPVPFPIRRFNI